MDSFEKNRIVASQVFRWGLVTFFLLPFLFLIKLFGQAEAMDWSEFYWAFKNTFLQSALSGLVCVFVGTSFALGLRWLQETRGRGVYSLARALLLLPAILPSLFVLLVGFELISPFPRGYIGIALMQTLASVGLCAVVIESILTEKLAALSEAAWIFGSTKWLFWKKAVRSVWFDFVSVFFFVFVFAFSSFAIPLIIGGSSGTTIEVLIYEKIRISSSWGQAVVLSILQTVMLAGLSFLPTRSSVHRSRQNGSRLLHSVFGAAVGLLYGVSFVAVFVFAGFSGWQHVLQMEGLLDEAVSLIPATVGLAFGAWFLFYFAIKGITYFWDDLRIPQFLRGYVAPSVALMGLVAVSLSGWTEISSLRHWLIYLGGLLILFLPSLFRMNWQGRLLSLGTQIRTAEVLGANKAHIFHQIIWPQLRGGAFGLALIGALWVMGDFALAKILFAQPVTLALLIESLLTSYRLEAAMAMTQIWILLALIVSLILWGGHRVRR